VSDRLKDLYGIKLNALSPFVLYNPHSLPVQFSRILDSLPEDIRKTVWRTGIGVEIEVENSCLLFIADWVSCKDGSLRDEGMEYKTRFGIRVAHVYKSLCDLKAVFDANTPHHKFSERCSVHVHVDVRFLTRKQLRSLLILYTIFEKLFFAVSSPHRENNIFCIPLRSSLLTISGTEDPCEVVGNAEKYSAFNLKTIKEFGTVEFRHHEGTANPDRLFRWILMCVLLVTAAKKLDPQELQDMVCKLKYESQYEMFLERVFFGLKGELPYVPQDLDVAVSDAKLFFSKEIK